MTFYDSILKQLDQIEEYLKRGEYGTLKAYEELGWIFSEIEKNASWITPLQMFHLGVRFTRVKDYIKELENDT